MSLYKSGIAWVRQSLTWSNSWSSWQERLILALFFVGAVGLGCLSDWLQLWQAALAWALYILALAICSRQGWLQLFGPVLFYDMIRTARQSRYLIMRLLYAGLLLIVLFFMYLNVDTHRHFDNPETAVWGLIGFTAFLGALIALGTLYYFIPARTVRGILTGLFALTLVLFFAAFLLVDKMDGPRGHEPINPRETAVLAEAFFSVFMIVQLIIVVLLTPAYVASAIAEEKDRKTLEFMLATDLNNREIVLSKLLSRLANMTLLLLTGLPILSILQFLGGVDTQLMLAGFAGTGLTLLGIASVSILFSTLLQKPRDAICITYLFIITYGSLGTTAQAMDLNGALLMKDALWFGADAPTLADASRVLNAGNPIAAIVHINIAINRASIAADLPALLANYAVFHGLLALACIVWSIVRLRVIALKQTVGGRTQKIAWWDRYRPPVGELPMMWKELNIEGRMKLNWLAWGIVIVLVLLTLGSGLMVLVEYFWDEWFRVGNQWRELPQNMNIWFRIAGTGVACLMILMVAVGASTCISSEKERDTFDALITTPMNCEAILAAKLLGSLTSIRMAWLWYGAMLTVALLTLGIHLLAVPLVIGAWFVYAVFFTMVGMWYSMSCATSMRATVYTVLTTLGLGGGHWLFTGLCCLPVYAVMRLDHPGSFPEYLLKFQLGMTPPFVLGLCAYSWQDLAHDWSRREFGELIAFSLIGLFLWAMACLILWYGVLLPKFRQLTRREELIYQ